jgi:flagellar hook assembly protein FlgD
MTAGLKEVSWDGRDDGGNAVGSGVYLYQLKAGTRTLAKKMVLLK